MTNCGRLCAPQGESISCDRLVRLFTFVGSTREQIVNAVKNQDVSLLRLEKLYAV
jgi:hypothetical protein